MERSILITNKTLGASFVFVFDILVIVVLAITVVRYWIKGLSGVVLDIAAYIVSVMAASLFGANIGSRLFESAVEDALAGTPMPISEHYLSPKSIAGALGFVAVFTAAFIICKILFKQLNKAAGIPVIGLINRILGAALGLVLGYLFVQVIVLAVFVPLQLFPAFRESFSDMVDASYVARWFFEHNLIRTLHGFY